MHNNLITQNTKALRKKTINLEEYQCPLIDRIINQAECYDIQSVRARFMKKDDLVPDFDQDKAGRLCKNCLYRQM
jgi:hypothetical protein